MTMARTLDCRGISSPNAGAQHAFMVDWVHRYVALEGGWMAGKTWAGARKLADLHIYNAFGLDDGEPTYVPSVVLAPTLGNLYDFDVPELRAAFRELGLRAELKVTGTLWQGQLAAPGLLVYGLYGARTPSVIILRTADAPERITGWQVGAAWGDEAARWKQDRLNPTRDPFTQLVGRVRHPAANMLQVLFTYTNEGDATRVYDEFRRGADTHALYRTATYDNPTAADFAANMETQLPPELQEQYLGGGAVNLTGRAAYGQFAGGNLDDTLTLQPHLPLQVAVDFNIQPGMHAVIGQYDTLHDVLTAVHEIHRPRLDVRGMVEELGDLLRSVGGWQWPRMEVFGDATGRSGWAGTGESCYDVLSEALRALQDKHGVDMGVRYRVPKANPAVPDRLAAFSVALCDMRGERHYRVHPRCERLIADFRKVRRGADGGVDKKADPTLTHASDADGYRVHYLRPVRRPIRQTGGRFSV